VEAAKGRRADLLMQAGVYARKSPQPDGANVHEDAKRITRQVENSLAEAARLGFRVSDAHIYTDDQVSGAEFERRPAFMRLLADVQRKPRPFDALIVMDGDRLGREPIETNYHKKRIVQSGIRIFSYLDQREIKFGTQQDKILESVLSVAAGIEREKAAARTKDSLLRKAKAGYVAGGRTFGYRNVRVDGHSEYRIDQIEAAAILRAFELYGHGLGFRKIAAQLNCEGASAPRARKGRPAGWSASTVRDVLHRSLYHGEIIWNRRKKRDEWGQRKTSRHPESEIIRVLKPELKIIPDARWEAVQARLHHQRGVYLRSTDGKRHGRPVNGVMSGYTLTGLATCGLCGAGLTVRTRTHGNARLPLWACRAHVEKGPTVCSNKHQMRTADADRAVLDALEANLLDPGVVERALQDAVAQLQQPADHDARRTTLQTRLRALTDEETNLTAAVAAGGQLPALVTALRDRAREKETIVTNLAKLDGMAKVARTDGTALRTKLRARIAEWRQILTSEPMVVRQLLGKLLAARLVFRPMTEPGGSVVYVFEGKARMDALLAGVVDGFGLTSGGRGSNGIRTRVSALRGPCPRPG
jgi:DNA invertase Pin-like site-specific DNA recombinase